MSVTVIRHQAIGNKVGVVISNSYVGAGVRYPVKFEVTFQLYLQSKAVDGLLLIHSDQWKSEKGAIDKFDNWVIEAQLEAA